MPPLPFKVLITAGSVAGLSLALMLEKNEIDFLILEAYPEIAPQIGASIGLWPNGLRILDQLGCYEDLLKLAENSINTTYFRGPDGIPMSSIEGMSDRLIERSDLSLPISSLC
jgi:2-polyprenyl-6-methoxyphenol hydroxylase-like FAD-dependent oxidoreductase